MIPQEMVTWLLGLAMQWPAVMLVGVDDVVAVGSSSCAPLCYCTGKASVMGMVPAMVVTSDHDNDVSTRSRGGAKEDTQSLPLRQCPYCHSNIMEREDEANVELEEGEDLKDKYVVST